MTQAEKLDVCSAEDGKKKMEAVVSVSVFVVDRRLNSSIRNV